MSRNPNATILACSNMALLPEGPWDTFYMDGTGIHEIASQVYGIALDRLSDSLPWPESEETLLAEIAEWDKELKTTNMPKLMEQVFEHIDHLYELDKKSRKN